MIDVAIAIDAEAVSLTLNRNAPGSYNIDGDFIDGALSTSGISATIQPVNGNQLMDMPEGIRTEAGWVVWSRNEIRLDDVIGTFGGGTLTFKGQKLTFNGGSLFFDYQPGEENITYRVLFVWPRREGGFYRAAIGRDVP